MQFRKPLSLHRQTRCTTSAILSAQATCTTPYASAMRYLPLLHGYGLHCGGLVAPKLHQTNAIVCSSTGRQRISGHMQAPVGSELPSAPVGREQVSVADFVLQQIRPDVFQCPDQQLDAGDVEE